MYLIFPTRNFNKVFQLLVGFRLREGRNEDPTSLSLPLPPFFVLFFILVVVQYGEIVILLTFNLVETLLFLQFEHRLLV